MKLAKKIIITIASASILMLPSFALASNYIFKSWDGYGTANDLGDLAHNYMYFWGIQSNIGANETITSAKISFNSIYNTNEFDPYDILKVYLLDNPKIYDIANHVDVVQVYDGELQTAPNEVPAYVGSKFSDYKYLWSWSDPGVANGQADPVTGAIRSNIGYTFDYLFTHDQLATLATYLASPTNSYNSTFGLGFDPDCLYNNRGITLTIETANAPVPEPGTIILLGAGLLSFAIYSRRREHK